MVSLESRIELFERQMNECFRDMHIADLIPKSKVEIIDGDLAIKICPVGYNKTPTAKHSAVVRYITLIEGQDENKNDVYTVANTYKLYGSPNDTQVFHFKTLTDAMYDIKETCENARDSQ